MLQQSDTGSAGFELASTITVVLQANRLSKCTSHPNLCNLFKVNKYTRTTLLWLFSSQYCKLWTHLTSSFIFLANNTARSIILLMILTYIWVNEIRICHIRVTNISWLEVSLESCQTFGMDFFCGNSVWNPLKIIFVKKLHHRCFSASKCASDAVVLLQAF